MITAIVGVAFLLLFYLLTPARLTPIVNNYCTEYLDAKVNFDSVQVSLFEEFPMVSLKLVGGEIISYALQSDSALRSIQSQETDTLLRFNEFMLSLNITDLIRSKVNIRRIRISQPELNAYISPSGRANWDIYTSTGTSGNETKIDLNIDRFAIRGPANLTYRSCPDSITAQASIGRLFMKGNFTPDIENLAIDRWTCSNVKIIAGIGKDAIHTEIGIDSASIAVIDPRREYDLMIQGMVSATIEKQPYCNSLPITLNGAIKFDPANDQFFGFKDFGLTVAGLPDLQLNGGVLLSDGTITSDLDFRINALPLQSLLALAPAGFSNEIEKIKTNVKISLNTSIQGVYEYAHTGKLPAIDMEVKIPSGYLVYKDLESKIENIILDASFHFNPASPKETGIKFRTIHIESLATRLKGSATIANLFDDPNVTLSLNGEANLQELVKFAPEDLGINARGRVQFQADGSFLMSRLTMQDLAKNDLTAGFTIDNLRVRIPKDTISLFAMKTSLELNTTQTRVNQNTNTVSRLLSMELKSDTARVRLPSREIIALSKLDFSMRSSESILTGDTSKVSPMVGNIQARNLEYSDVDSTTFNLRDIKTNFRILPSRENRSLPTLRFDIESRQLSIYAKENRFGLRDASISLVATKNETPSQRRPNTASQRQGNRLRTDDFTGEDFDLKADAAIVSILREWTVDGNIQSRSGRMITPHFPLRTRLQNVDITFTTNDITLQNAHISCGESQFDFTGKISGIRRALSSGRGLQVTADIKADTLEANELITALFNGMAYSDSSDGYRQSLAGAKDEDELEKIIQEENENKEETSTLLVIPSNLSVDVRFDIAYGEYADVTIHKMTGELISRDRCLQLKDISAKTDIGDIDLTALYATRSRKDVTLGMDLEFNDIQVESFIHIIPAIDSLIPMLSSFKGVVNCQVAATAAMDSTMDIILPSLNAACRISGKNMVLLDGETFTQIANTLKFKNRQENRVDSIAIEMLVRNNQIEIFPFIMQMDRYRTAISGVHNLDMTFNYHISVLKSPLPFMMGLNLSGNLNAMDRMKMNIGKARYKDTHLPTYVTVIDTTRLNLRSQIDKIVQQGVDAVRFSQFAAPQIDPDLLDKEAESTRLSAADSLALYREGIIEEMPSELPDE